MHRGKSMSPEAEIALEDVRRLRDDVQRGRERLFHSSLSITLHARDSAELKDMTQGVRAHFAATLGKLDTLAFRQREGLLSALPISLNALELGGRWTHLRSRASSRFPRLTSTHAAARSTASTSDRPRPSSTTRSMALTSTPIRLSLPAPAAANRSPRSLASSEASAVVSPHM